VRAAFKAQYANTYGQFYVGQKYTIQTGNSIEKAVRMGADYGAKPAQKASGWRPGKTGATGTHSVWMAVSRREEKICSLEIKLPGI
jgi:hypothetical protein